MIHGRRAPRVSQRKNLNDDAAVLQLVGDVDADANDGAGDSSDGAPLEDGSPCWLVLGLGGAEDVLAGHGLVSAQDVADLPQEVGGTGSGILVGGALGGVLGGGQRSGGVRGLGVLLCTYTAVPDRVIADAVARASAALRKLFMKIFLLLFVVESGPLKRLLSEEVGVDEVGCWSNDQAEDGGGRACNTYAVHQLSPERLVAESGLVGAEDGTRISFFAEFQCIAQGASGGAGLGEVDVGLFVWQGAAVLSTSDGHSAKCDGGGGGDGQSGVTELTHLGKPFR